MSTTEILGTTTIVGTATGEIVWLGDEDFWVAERRLAWNDWARQHHIDPAEALGFFEIDRAARRIRYLAYDLNEKGRRFARPDGKWASASMREVQLDGPIAELPTAVDAGLAAV